MRQLSTGADRLVWSECACQQRRGSQYFKSIGTAPTCIDTDPANQTLVNYKALNASHLPLMAENSSRVDERKFDGLMEQLLSKDGVFVVDNGSASFIPLSNYLLENG